MASCFSHTAWFVNVTLDRAHTGGAVTKKGIINPHRVLEKKWPIFLVFIARCPQGNIGIHFTFHAAAAATEDPHGIDLYSAASAVGSKYRLPPFVD